MHTPKAEVIKGKVQNILLPSRPKHIHKKTINSSRIKSGPAMFDTFEEAVLATYC